MLTSPIPRTEHWRRQYGTRLDEVAAGGASRAIDGQNDLVIAGGSSMIFRDTFTDGEFAVFKIDGATGDELWSWTGSTGWDFNDRVYAVTVDAAGDIIGGGVTTGTWYPAVNPGGADWAAFKLDGTTAEELWRYQRPFEYDNETGWGRIYGTGTSSEGNAYFTGFSAFLDASGSTEVQYMIAKVNGTTGEELWAVEGGSLGTYDLMQGCAVDSQDYLVVAGMTDEDVGRTASSTAGSVDAVVVKLDSTGQEVWVYQDGGDLWDEAYAVAIDSGDNVYVVGGYEVVHEPFTIANYATVRKLNGSDGGELWRYDGFAPSGDGCIFFGVALDEASGTMVAVGITDGVWVEGGSSSGGGGDFAATILNATTGDELGRWQDGTDEYDKLSFAGFDSEGSLFMVGTTSGAWGQSQGEYDFVAAKFALGADRGGNGPSPAMWVIATAVAAAAVIVLLLAVSSWFLWRRRNTSRGAAKPGSEPAGDEAVVDIPGPSMRKAAMPTVEGRTLPPPYSSVSTLAASSPTRSKPSDHPAGASPSLPRVGSARQSDKVDESGKHGSKDKAESCDGCDSSEPPSL